MRTHLARLRRHRLLVLALAILGAQIASAQTSTWTGATDTALNNAANWDTLPTSSATTALVVGSSTRTTIVNDVTGGLTLNSLTFTADAGTYTLSGTPLIFSGANATLASYSTASADVTLSSAIQLANTLTVEGDAGDFVGQLLLTGVTSGTGGLVWHSGVGFISGSNTYSGGTLISGGTVGINKASAFGTGPVVVNGGALQLQGGVNVNRTLTLSGTGYALHSSEGSNTWSGAVTLAGDATIGSFRPTTSTSSNLTLSGALDLAGHTLTVDARSTGGELGGTTTTTIAGALTGTGNIIKTGGGTLFLQNFTGSTWTGDLNVQAGTLLLYGTYDPLGALTNNLTLASGTTLTTATNLEAHNVLLDGVGVVTVNGANTGSDYLANLSGTAGLTIAQGSVNLIGNNTFSGALTVGNDSVTSATLQINSATRLGTSSDPLTLNNGKLLFNDSAASFTFAADHDLVLGANGGTLLAASGKTITVSGDISGAGKLTITGTTNTAGGTVLLTGTNTRTGGTLVSLATLGIDSDAALGGSSGALDLNKGTLLATNDFTVAATRTTTITGTSTVNTQGFDVTFAQARSGTGTLVKTGTGTLTLTGSAADSSSYMVNGGTLVTSLDHALGLDATVYLASGTLLRLGGDASISYLSGSDGTVDLAANKTLTVGIGDALLTGTGTLRLANSRYNLGADTSVGILLDGGTLAGTKTFTLGGTAPLTVSPTGGTLRASLYETVTLERSVDGSGALTLSGGSSYDEASYLSDFGTWHLNTATAHTGTTRIVNANVELAADHVLSPGVLTLSGAGLSAVGAPRTLAQAITINDLDAVGRTTFSGENLTLSGVVTLNTSAGFGLASKKWTEV